MLTVFPLALVCKKAFSCWGRWEGGGVANSRVTVSPVSPLFQLLGPPPPRLVRPLTVQVSAGLRVSLYLG